MEAAVESMPLTGAPMQRRAALVVPVVALAAFMEILDISIANVALEHIAGSLSASRDESTWILTSYLVANAIALPISGWLASVFGRKRFFLGCIVGFSISSMLCGLAPTLGTLIVCRALQGATGGGLQPLSQAIMADAVPEAKRGMAFAVYGIAAVFAPAIGPTLGGWITDSFSWRWVFLINVPVGIVVSGLVWWLVADPPELVRARVAKLKAGIKIDYIGFGLLALGLGMLQIMLDKGQIEDWFASNLIVILAVTCVVALTAFVYWEWRQHDPIVDLHLFRDRSFVISNLLMLMLGCVLFGSTVLVPLYTQQILGYTAMQAGMVLTPGGFAVIATLPLVGYLSARVDPRWLIAFGLLICSLGLFHMTNFSTESSFSFIAWARVFQALGLGFLFIPINTVAFAGIPPERSSNASAIINLSRNLGGGIGIALMTTMLVRREQFHQHILTANVTVYDESYQHAVQQMVHTFIAQGATAAEALTKAQAQIYGLLQQQAAMLAYIDDYWLLGVTFMSLIPLVFLIRKRKGTGAPPPAH